MANTLSLPTMQANSLGYSLTPKTISSIFRCKIIAVNKIKILVSAQCLEIKGVDGFGALYSTPYAALSDGLLAHRFDWAKTV